MRIVNIFLVAVFLFISESVFAHVVVTQEVVNVQIFANGSTTLRLSGTLSRAAMTALSNGAEIAIQNNLINYLCAPTRLSVNKKGFWKKSDSQNIFISANNGQFKWTEKNVTRNFAFAVRNESVEPTKATLNSSGILKRSDFASLGSQKVTLLDIPSNETGLGCVGAKSFVPEKKRKNYKYLDKGSDLQVKFYANARGKTTTTFKFFPNVVSPAFISENYYDSTNHPPIVPPTPPVVKDGLYMVIDLSGGTNAANFKISYLNKIPEGGWTEEYKTTKMVLRRVEAGKFTMGSPESELGRYDNEVQHEVRLTKSFYIGVFETTQKQYKLITGTDPSDYWVMGDTRPVQNISYQMLRGDDKGGKWPASHDVDETSFFGILRSKTGMNFDLPTEAQWEFACRAGTTTALNSGKNLSDPNECDEMAEVGRYYLNRFDGRDGDNREFTTVGLYLPNAWGLYDMHGNVEEWCLDWYDLYYGDATDPKGAEEGEWRVQRGGSCYNYCSYYASNCRSAYRTGFYPYTGFNDYNIGFRVVLVE